MKMQIQCPNCKSYRTQCVRTSSFIVGAVLTLFGIGFSWFIFPIVLIPVGLLIFALAFGMSKDTYRCVACKRTFQPGDKEI